MCTLLTVEEGALGGSSLHGQREGHGGRLDGGSRISAGARGAGRPGGRVMAGGQGPLEQRPRGRHLQIRRAVEEGEEDGGVCKQGGGVQYCEIGEHAVFVRLQPWLSLLSVCV